MNHITGRKAHSRLRDEIKKRKGMTPDRVEVFIAAHTRKNGEIVDEASAEAITRRNDRLSEVPEPLQTSSFREQVFTEIMGPDGHGRVRTYGLGPSPSDIFPKPSREEYAELRRINEGLTTNVEMMKEEMRIWKEKNELIEKKVQMLETHILNQANMTDLPSDVHTNSRQVPDASSAHSHQSHLVAPRNQELSSSNGTPSISQEIQTHAKARKKNHNIAVIAKVSKKVTLQGFHIPKRSVAKGFLISNDPSKMVGGEPLGQDFCEVFVAYVSNRREKLLRPFGDILTLGEAENEYIAWPSADVHEE